MSRCEAKFSPFEGSGNIWPGNDIALMHNLRTREQCSPTNSVIYLVYFLQVQGANMLVNETL